MKQVFSLCYCNDLLTMVDGKIYRCPYSANGRVLQAIPPFPEDCVDVYEEECAFKLRKLIFDKDYDNACGYCSGRNFHLGTVEPAVQTREPLTYRKYTE